MFSKFIPARTSMMAMRSDTAAAVPVDQVAASLPAGARAAVDKIPQPAASNIGPRFTAALVPAATKRVSTYNPLVRAQAVTAGASAQGSLALQRLAVPPSLTGCGALTYAQNLKPASSTMRVVDSASDGGASSDWMLYGAYALAGFAVLGLGYVAFRSKKKVKPAPVPPDLRAVQNAFK